MVLRKMGRKKGVKFSFLIVTLGVLITCKKKLLKIANVNADLYR